MHRDRAIGIALSGMLSDGTSGLWTIKRFGGTTIVQDLDEAAFDSMPLNALEQVEVDFILPASEMGPLVSRLPQASTTPAVPPDHSIMERVLREVDVAFVRRLLYIPGFLRNPGIVFRLRAAARQPGARYTQIPAEPGYTMCGR